MRIRQKRMSNDAEDCTEHSIIWGMFMATTLNAVTFMGKNYSTMQNVVQNEENLTLKQMFDITAQTIHSEEEIYCLDKVVYQKNSWTQLSLLNDPVIISLQCTICPHHGDALLDGNAQSVRYGEIIHDGSGQPDSANYQEQAYSENFVMGSDAAEFENKVKDQVRNRQKRMSNVAESGDEHSIIWRVFMAATLNAATFMGKNFSTIQTVVKNYEDLTLKQMFDVTAQLVNNQEEINCLDKIQWEKYSWTRLSLIGDETVINLQRTKVYVFSDSVLCLGRVLQHPDSNKALEE